MATTPCTSSCSQVETLLFTPRLFSNYDCFKYQHPFPTKIFRECHGSSHFVPSLRVSLLFYWYTQSYFLIFIYSVSKTKFLLKFYYFCICFCHSCGIICRKRFSKVIWVGPFQFHVEKNGGQRGLCWHLIVRTIEATVRTAVSIQVLSSLAKISLILSILYNPHV